MEITEETIDEIIELYDRAQEEHKTNPDKDYWQGRKDGLRLALSMIQPERRIWRDLNKSSYGFQLEEKEGIMKFMRLARYDIADILMSIQEKEPIHIQTRINLIQWIAQYDMLSNKGMTIKVDDSVDKIPGFMWRVR